MRAKLAPWWFLGLLWLLAASHAWSATTATVTPGDWALYGGTSILSNVLLWIEVTLFSVSKTIAPIVNLLVTIPLNFIINKLWTFKER